MIAICFGCKTKTSKNILYGFIRIVFTHDTIGEHSSPLQSGYKFVLQTDYLPDHNCPTGQFHRPQGRFHLTKSDFTRHRRISLVVSGVSPETTKAPGLRRPGAFLCSLKNEGYNYESLFRLALRRVEQLYSDGCGSVFLSTLILNNANMKTV